MTKNRTAFAFVYSALTMLTLAGCSGKSFMGGVEVKNKSINGLPTASAHTIYVADFAAPPNLKLDPTASGLQGMLNQGNTSTNGPGGGILSRLRQRSQPTVHGTPQEQSAQIVNGLAEDLTSSLRDKGFDAQRWNGQSGNLPKNGWLVKGEFNVVDEGNRVERAEIGFGQGATQMDVAVHVYDLAGKNPGTAFADFDTTKNPGMKPGGAVTMNPYAAAAKFHMEKNATAKDIKQTGSEIAEEIAKLGKPGG
jgi:Domain of unknown function (DUF4410)